MSDPIVDGVSSYYLGSPDTQTAVENNVDNVEDRHVNGTLDSSLQVQQALGAGPVLYGTHNNLGERLAVRHNADGTHKIAPINEGGTNINGYTKGDLLYASVTNVLSKLPIGIEGKQLLIDENGLPIWGTGAIWTGPTGIAAGSSIGANGDIVRATNDNESGLILCDSYTINSSVVMTIPTGLRFLIVYANKFITINGTITGIGAGAAGGASPGVGGNPGLDGVAGAEGAGGGGGGAALGDFPGGDGGTSVTSALTVGAGGAGSVSAGSPGGTGANANTTYALLHLLRQILIGGSGGGSGGSTGSDDGGVGGNGGASVLLVSPIINFGASAVMTVDGAAGGVGSGDAAGGGGGGAGCLGWMTRRYNNAGVTLSVSGGAGGLASGSGSNGGSGGNGTIFGLTYG